MSKEPLLTKMKRLEIRLLGRYASTYCYNTPFLIEFDISSKCNLKCTICFRGQEDFEEEPLHNLSLEDFKKIIDRFNKLYLIQFRGCCEPTLNPELVEMINYVKDKGAKQVELFTNGTTLKGQILDKISNSKLDSLKVSIDSPDEKVYKSIRGTDLSKVLDNIKAFTSISDIPVTVESVIFKENIHTVIDFPKMLNDMGGNILELRLLTGAANNVGYRSIYGKFDLDKVVKEVDEECKKYELVFIKPDLEIVQKYICASFIDMNVDYKGFVTPCYYRPRERLSKNLITDSLVEVWNGEELRKNRKEYLQGKSSQNHTCSAALLRQKRIKMED